MNPNLYHATSGHSLTSRYYDTEHDLQQMQALLMETRSRTDDWLYAHVGELLWNFCMVACHWNPPVMALRRKLILETPRCRFIARSALDLAWLDEVSTHAGRPYLFIAEGVFMFFEEADMRRLVLALRERFPGAELVFDICSPLIMRLQNIHLALMKADFRMLEHPIRQTTLVDNCAPAGGFVSTSNFKSTTSRWGERFNSYSSPAKRMNAL